MAAYVIEIVHVVFRTPGGNKVVGDIPAEITAIVCPSKVKQHALTHWVGRWAIVDLHLFLLMMYDDFDGG